MIQLDKANDLWDAVLVVWEDVGHRVARPIIAAIERRDWSYATNLACDEYESLRGEKWRYQRDALEALVRKINAAWETDKNDGVEQ